MVVVKVPGMHSFRSLITASCGTVAAAALVLAPGSEARIRQTFCGHVRKTVAVSAHELACKPARKVAITYLDGTRDPYGFSCRRYKVSVAAGWWAKCTRGNKFVQVTPE